MQLTVDAGAWYAEYDSVRVQPVTVSQKLVGVIFGRDFTMLLPAIMDLLINGQLVILCEKGTHTPMTCQSAGAPGKSSLVH